MSLKVTDETIQELKKYDTTIKDQILSTLSREENVVNIGHDNNHLKFVIDSLIPKNICNSTKSILKMYIFEQYMNLYSDISNAVSAYLISESLKVLENIDLQIVYNTSESQSVYNNFLEQQFSNSNELQLDMLFEKFIQFLDEKIYTDSITYFHIHVIDQLFNNKLYEQIFTLIDEYELNEFDAVVGDLSSYIHVYLLQLSYSLFKFHSFEKSFEITAIALYLKCKPSSNFVMKQLLLQYFILSMILNKDKRQICTNIIIHKNIISMNLLNLYQNFQTSNLSSFMHNIMLLIDELKFDGDIKMNFIDQNILSLLTKKLIDNKFEVISQKFDNSLIRDYQTQINKLIHDINPQLEKYGYKIQDYKYIPKQENIYDNFGLIIDTQRLMYANECLKEYNYQ